MEGKFSGPKSQDVYMAHFATQLSTAFVRPGGIEKVTLVKSTDSIDADAVITGEFLELNGGSSALRFWVGDGAGTAKTRVRLQAYRADQRTQIFGLQHARFSPFTLSDDANIANIDPVVRDIGELLRNRAVCNPVDIPPPAAPDKKKSDASAKATGKVSIESSVPNADASIDGKFVGNAPLVGYKLPPGDHVIEISAAGYATWKRTLAVSPASPTRVVATLGKSP